jgi:hypothetical protein
MLAAIKFIIATRRDSRIMEANWITVDSASRRNNSAAAFAPSCMIAIIASRLAVKAALSVLSALFLGNGKDCFVDE